MSTENRIRSLQEFDEAFSGRFAAAAAITPVRAPEPMPQMEFYPQAVQQQPYPQAAAQNAPMPHRQMRKDEYFPQNYEASVAAAYPAYSRQPMPLSALPQPEPPQPMPTPPAPQQWSAVTRPPSAGQTLSAQEAQRLAPPPKPFRLTMKQKALGLGTVAVLLILLLAVLVPRLLFGIEFLAMGSESMGETIPLGSLVIIKKAPFEEVLVGDIITYEYGRGNLVTRRVVDKRSDPQVIATKGDNADGYDPPVAFEAVRGVVRWHGRLLGYPLYWMRLTASKIIATAIFIAAWGALFYQTSDAWVKKRKRSQADETEA